MVAGSSLRHPPQPIYQHQHDPRPNNEESPPLSLRSKRIRATTLAEQDQDHKRRKVAIKKPEPLRIPLRGRTILPHPESDPKVGTPPKGVDLPTPTGKPQYDQIRIIEAKAKASIRSNGSQKSSQDERRKLRSEDGGTRSNTELAQYFSSFKEMLSLEPPDPETLTGHTNIVLVDDIPDYEPPSPRNDPFGARKPLHKTEIIELPIPAVSKRTVTVDPMSEDAYLTVHRKAERHEKQMKNGDRERAQHEKYQLERLLEELRGPDWLKTLGISGITDTEKKRYEPKRLLFIRETQALIDKFKWWKEEEKRRKLQREQELLEEAENGDEQQSVSHRSYSTQPPNSSELDALASQQLLEEAKSASKRKKMAAQEVVLPPPAYKAFTSFFAKRHLRDAAVSGRQRGRTILAFGHTVPDLEVQEFELPETILTEDAIRASQRSRRRRKRDVDD